jgi:hypothetical protein
MFYIYFEIDINYHHLYGPELEPSADGPQTERTFFIYHLDDIFFLSLTSSTYSLQV